MAITFSQRILLKCPIPCHRYVHSELFLGSSLLVVIRLYQLSSRLDLVMYRLWQKWKYIPLSLLLLLSDKVTVSLPSLYATSVVVLLGKAVDGLSAVHVRRSQLVENFHRFPSLVVNTDGVSSL